MLFALAGLWYFLAIACGIAGLVFFIMVLIQMFKRDQTNLGIICIVLTFCTGVGPLIAFIYGWMKSTEWDIKKIMTYWTVAFALQFVFVGLAVVSVIGGAATMDPSQFDVDPNNMNIEFDMGDTQFDFESDFSMPDDATMPEEAVSPDATLPEESATDQP